VTRPLTRVLLASASPRRLTLLRSIGLDVHAAPTGYGEAIDRSLDPPALALEHARAKREIAWNAWGEGGSFDLIVAADTVVDVDGDALGKPRDAADAAGMLRRLSGREHRVHTAVALALPAPGEIALAEVVETTRVRFFPLSNDEIATYAASREPMDKAGAYGIQGYGATFVESVAGDFYAVMGFPLARFARAVRSLGFTLPKAN
jgi:nucleoside triphosphate pyrophosphatase